MRTIFLLVLTASLLSACGGASKVWIRNNTDLATSQKDWSECDYASSQGSFVPMNAFTSAVSAGMQEGIQKINLMNKCMTSKGYYLTDKKAHEDTLAKQNSKINAFRQALDAGNGAKAIEEYKSVKQDFPNDCNVEIGGINAFRMNSEYSTALKMANQLVSNNICTEDQLDTINLIRVDLFVFNRELDLAKALIQRNISKKNSSQWLSKGAYIESEKGEPETAIQYAIESIAIAPAPNAYKSLAMAYFRLGKYDEALENTYNALLLNSNYAFAYEVQYLIFEAKGDTDKSQSAREKACNQSGYMFLHLSC